MTPHAFCQSGKGERVKLAVHGAMLVGATACAVYNTAAWLYRRETHNAVNAIVYGLLTCLEVAHVKHHASHG